MAALSLRRKAGKIAFRLGRLYTPVRHHGYWSINALDYDSAYKASVTNPDRFWDGAKRALSWHIPYHTVDDSRLESGHVAFYLGGKLNACENAIDRHLEFRSSQIALIWEKDEPGQTQYVTYRELYENTCRMANVLRRYGVKKGDAVGIYLPTIPEAVYAMLACARIGALHTVVFAGFSADSLKARLQDCNSKILITADQGVRGGKIIQLKDIADKALAGLPGVEKVFVVPRTGAKVTMKEGRDINMQKAMAIERTYSPAEIMDSEDLLFILYTSGSTGKPKGLGHSTAGYLAHVSLSHRHVFDYRDGDVFACVADVGWITGHTYAVYGPLLNGGTTVLFESMPNYPNEGRYWDLVEKHRVTQFYTAPTAIRSLIKAGPEWVKKYNRSSLRVLGSVGEPINPEAWQWYYDVVGDSKVPIVDTWWQTELGGVVMSPLPQTKNPKPGSCMIPFYGCQPCLLDEKGKEIKGNDVVGQLALKRAIPGMARTIVGDHARFVQTYFNEAPGYYVAGDESYRDKDGHYWIRGRIDDVINVSGHRLGTAEVESALVKHASVAEAAVVGYPHEIKGEGIFAYVTLKAGKEESSELAQELKNIVRADIGPFATPDRFLFTSQLPKTRSGKIMRRILKKIVKQQTDFGDLSTLADPEIVETLIKKEKELREKHGTGKK